MGHENPIYECAACGWVWDTPQKGVLNDRSLDERLLRENPNDPRFSKDGSPENNAQTFANVKEAGLRENIEAAIIAIEDSGYNGNADEWRWAFVDADPADWPILYDELLSDIQRMGIRQASLSKEADLNAVNPNAMPGSGISGVVCEACNSVISVGQGQLRPATCPNCQAPLSSATNPDVVASLKEAQLPGGADQPPAQGTMQQPGPVSMPTAPNPAMMGDEENPNQVVQDQKVLAREEIANESAAKHFSQIQNLDELKDEIVKGLANQYQLPDSYVHDHLVIQAKFDQANATNGELNKEIDLENYQEVNPSTKDATAPQNPLNAIKRGATVPVKLIISKIMKEQNTDEVTALNMFKDSWGGETPPDTFNVMVSGELKYFLPTEAVGDSPGQTESPFPPPQAPEDVMDQQYNEVPEQPAH